MTRFIPVVFATITTFALMHPAMAGPTDEQTASSILDLTPAVDESVEQNSNTYRGLNTPSVARPSEPQTRSLLDRAGLDPDIEASATSLGASQRIDVGGQHLPETQTLIQPYLELGANAERRADTALFAQNDLDAEVTAQIGGVATISVNDQIDFRLGYTREEPLGSASITGDAEDKVETGVRIRF